MKALRLCVVLAIASLTIDACAGSFSPVPQPESPAQNIPASSMLLPNGKMAPFQAHAIAIGTPAPTLNPCLTTSGTDCHVKKRADIPALLDSLGLLPSAVPGLHPADLSAAYSLPSSTAGANQTIAIVVAYSDPSAESDLAVYRKKFGLGACTVAGKCLRFVGDAHKNALPKANSSWAYEQSIDLDMASAICPKCTLEVVEANSDTVSDMSAALMQAIALKPSVVSNSWSIPDATVKGIGAFTLVHPGIAVVAGSGDNGSGISWPAAYPSVIAVGGTTLSRDPLAARGWDESTWQSAGYGCSTDSAKPSYQSSAVCGNARAVADVSAVADPNTGVAIYNSYSGAGGWAVYGGTSVATPIVAATIALAGNGAVLSDPSFIYAHTSGLNPVAVTSAALQGGLGSPKSTSAF